MHNTYHTYIIHTTHSYIHMHAFTVCMSAWYVLMCMYGYVCICAMVCMSAQYVHMCGMYVCVCVRVCMYACMYVRYVIMCGVYVCMYVCMWGICVCVVCEVQLSITQAQVAWGLVSNIWAASCSHIYCIYIHSYNKHKHIHTTTTAQHNQPSANSTAQHNQHSTNSIT